MEEEVTIKWRGKIVNPLKQEAKQNIYTVALHHIPKRQRDRETGRPNHGFRGRIGLTPICGG
jgi:hypothetical protein